MGGAAIPVVEFTKLLEWVVPPRRLLGLDVGNRTVGLAMCDVGWLIATPMSTLARSRLRIDVETIAEIVAAHDVGGFVVGLPIEMSGLEGDRARAVRDFAARLVGAVDLPAVFWDERLSTKAVERMLVDEVDMSRRRRARIVDKLAAAYILQGALDALTVRTGRPPPTRTAP